MYDTIWATKLQEFYNAGDPLADEAILAVETAQGAEGVQNLLKSLVLEVGITFTPMVPELEKYLHESAQLPSWANPETMKDAADLFAEYSLEIVMMLFSASLPTLYAGKQGAEVLTLTKRMVNYTYLERRIFETAQFVLDVTSEGAFQPGGMGFDRTQKVRLMHAAIRHLIDNDPKWAPHWESTWGTPINQVELSGTMLSFSLTVLEGLSGAGLTLEADERETYLHLWKVIGHLIGVRAELMPQNYDDAAALMATCQLLYTQSSPTGRILTDVLVQFLLKHSGVSPGLITDGIRRTVGHYTADTLGLPDWHWTRIFLVLQKAVWSLESLVDRRLPLISHISRSVERRIILSLMNSEHKRVVDDDTAPPSRRSTTLKVPQHMRKTLKVD